MSAEQTLKEAAAALGGVLAALVLAMLAVSLLALLP